MEKQVFKILKIF